MGTESSGKEDAKILRVRRYRTCPGEPLVPRGRADIRPVLPATASATPARPGLVIRSVRPMARPTASGPPLPADPDLVRAIETIRAETLPAPALLRARKLAAERGMVASSDLDAVRQLRAAGIPVEPGLPVPAPASALQTMRKADLLPALVPAAGDPAGKRPRDPAGATRRLAFRLGVLVGLPTAAAAIWFSAFATPIYATYSEFVVQNAQQTQPMPGGAMAAMAGASLPGNQDSIALQGFLTSREAYAMLDRDHDLRSHLSDPDIDPLHRLRDGASEEEAFKAFENRLDVGFDPAEGIIRMTVTAFDPDFAAKISRSLVGYAEARIDGMSRKLRDDALANAEAAADRQIGLVGGSLAHLAQIQAAHETLSAPMEAQILQEQLGPLQARLIDERLALAEMMSNASPNQARLSASNRTISALEGQVAELRGRMTGDDAGSVAAAQAELAGAEAELAARQQILANALATLETARAQSLSQARFLSIAVEPYTPDRAEYPKPIQDTLIFFLANLGLYMIGSLGLTLLRNEVEKS